MSRLLTFFPTSLNHLLSSLWKYLFWKSIIISKLNLFNPYQRWASRTLTFLICYAIKLTYLQSHKWTENYRSRSLSHSIDRCCRTYGYNLHFPDCRWARLSPSLCTTVSSVHPLSTTWIRLALVNQCRRTRENLPNCLKFTTSSIVELRTPSAGFVCSVPLDLMYMYNM